MVGSLDENSLSQRTVDPPTRPDPPTTSTLIIFIFGGDGDGEALASSSSLSLSSLPFVVSERKRTDVVLDNGDSDDNDDPWQFLMETANPSTTTLRSKERRTAAHSEHNRKIRTVIVDIDVDVKVNFVVTERILQV